MFHGKCLCYHQENDIGSIPPQLPNPEFAKKDRVRKTPDRQASISPKVVLKQLKTPKTKKV